MKNLNSFRFVEKAIKYEINRQIDALENGGNKFSKPCYGILIKGFVFRCVQKKKLHDYRYFPDPDLVPVLVNQTWIDDVKAKLPELPKIRCDRYINEFKLPKYDASILTGERELADYFDGIILNLKIKNEETYKIASNWTMVDVLRVVNDQHISVLDFPISPKNLSDMINLIFRWYYPRQDCQRCFRRNAED